MVTNTCCSRYSEAQNRRTAVHAVLGINARLYFQKRVEAKMVGGMAQVIQATA
jgi:hypothetical protein